MGYCTKGGGVKGTVVIVFLVPLAVPPVLHPIIHRDSRDRVKLDFGRGETLTLFLALILYIIAILYTKLIIKV